MRSQLKNVKLGSLGVWSRVLAACACISVLTGCIIVDSNSTSTTNTNGNTTPPPPTDPLTLIIDSDVALDAKPGDGVGIFVEYTTGGRYRIWTTCDTLSSGAICPFDIYTSVDTSSSIISVTEDNLEGYDSVTVQQNQGTADLHFETDNDYDAITIDVTPGAVLRVEAYLDGKSEPRFIYWVGEGVLHEGAPTNPVDLSPSKP
jgi:hypothetical protein